jgi:hypothetical protein
MTTRLASGYVAAFCLTLIIGAACGSKSSGAPAPCAPPQDGSRLKAQILRAEDGAWEDMSRHGQWYDSLLATRCQFLQTADGGFRCLPVPLPPTSFGDAGCSQLVARARPCASGPPRYGFVNPPPTCAMGEWLSPYAVHALGPGTVPAAVYYEQTSSGVLQCMEAANSDRTEVYPFLSEIAPAEFVGATFERAPGARIHRNLLVAEDGARGGMWGRAFDSVLGTDCFVDLAADGQWRCLPFEATVGRAGWTFADASCSQGIAIQPGRMCAPDFRRTLVSIEERRICTVIGGVPLERYPPKLHVHQLGATSTPAQTFSKTEAADGSVVCEAAPNAEATPYSEIRAELPPTNFVRVSEREISCGPLGASGRRLKAHHTVSDDDDVAWPTLLWIDSETGQDCSFGRAADGIVRCLPRHRLLGAVGDFRLFADASCSRAVVGASRCVDYPRGVPKFTVIDEEVSECVPGVGLVDFQTRVHAVGAAVTPATLYMYSAGSPARCLPIDEAVGGRTEDLLLEYELRELGSEVPPGTFVAGSIQTP